jgi:hypothetical protein
MLRLAFVALVLQPGGGVIVCQRKGNVMKSSLQHMDDLREGNAWWQARSKEDKAAWLAKVCSDRPMDAWEAFKRSLVARHLL